MGFGGSRDYKISIYVFERQRRKRKEKRKERQIMSLRNIYFNEKELACGCKSPACDALDMDPRFLLMVDQIRHKWGKPLVVTSARRCKQHNMAVGGAVKSMHVYGRALDIVVAPDDHFKFLDLVRREGITGVGRAATWFHIDNRDGKFTTWTY